MTGTEESAVLDTDQATDTAPPRRRTSVIVAAALLVGAGGLAAGGWFGWQQHRATGLDRARAEAREAACAYGSLLSTYDATDLDTYFAAVLDHATGAWKQEFAATSADLRDVLVQGQVRSSAGTVECAIATGTADSAEAIVVVDQSITSVGTQQQPRRGQLAITLSLDRSGDRWLTSKVSSPLLRTP
ncbi:hypothetical protein ACFXK0_12255 [Nocardia sp. NPDC059177]|uniref:hypothetical protein n=1 Tax=Nocardia sp. NPDC059177 TaxID=3346759 RepID=UPI00368E1CFD